MGGVMSGARPRMQSYTAPVRSRLLASRSRAPAGGPSPSQPDFRRKWRAGAGHARCVTRRMGLAHVSHRVVSSPSSAGHRLRRSRRAATRAKRASRSRSSTRRVDLPELFTNDQTAFDYFVGKGLTNFQAAGIVGNLDQESGDSPTAVQSGGPGRGVAQWSVGGRWDTGAGDNEDAYVSQQAKSSGPAAQLDFIWYELHDLPRLRARRAEGRRPITEATVAFERTSRCAAPATRPSASPTLRPSQRLRGRRLTRRRSWPELPARRRRR